MSERMTAVEGPAGSGLMEYGRRNREEMIAAYRRYYESQRDEAEQALAASDEDLTVTTFLGPVVMRRREVVQ